MKPTFRYVDIAQRVTVGQQAQVLLRSGERWVTATACAWYRTSLVQRIIHYTASGPVFETMNSTYTPYPDNDADAPTEETLVGDPLEST